MKKGFTLVELLAVIVILGIIAVIVTPKVTNSLKESEEKTNLASAKGLLKAAEYRYQDNELKGIEENITINYETGQNIDKLEYSGEKPESGKIQVTSEGKISMAVKIKNKCYIKSFGSEEINVQEYNVETCKISISFADDSWTDIKANLMMDRNSYQIGDIKNINLGDLGVHKIRISNKTSPNECKTDDFSQSSCGVVLEFSDIITLREMNSEKTSAGGWEASGMRRYLNEDIYALLPEDLKRNIIDTKVISGHSYVDSNDFITTDKLYLLSPTEVFGTPGVGSTYDSALNKSRQLDYYVSQSVQVSSAENARKKYNNSYTSWWLRTALSVSPYNFIDVYASSSDGFGNESANNSNYGVSPAFRILD